MTETRIIDDKSCGGLTPIILSSRDVISDDTAKQLAAQYLKGVKNCGWKPLK